MKHNVIVNPRIVQQRIDARDNLKKEKSDLMEQYAKKLTSKQVSEVNNEPVRKQTKHAKNKDDSAKLLKKIERLESKVHQLTMDNRKLQGRYSDLSRKHKGYTEKAEGASQQLTKELKSAYATIEQQRDELASVQSDLKASQVIANTRGRLIAKKERRIKEQTQQLRNQKKKYNNLQSQTNPLRGTLQARSQVYKAYLYDRQLVNQALEDREILKQQMTLDNELVVNLAEIVDTLSGQKREINVLKDVVVSILNNQYLNPDNIRKLMGIANIIAYRLKPEIKKVADNPVVDVVEEENEDTFGYIVDDKTVRTVAGADYPYIIMDDCEVHLDDVVDVSLQNDKYGKVAVIKHVYDSADNVVKGTPVYKKISERKNVQNIDTKIVEIIGDEPTSVLAGRHIYFVGWRQNDSLNRLLEASGARVHKITEVKTSQSERVFKNQQDKPDTLIVVDPQHASHRASHLANITQNAMVVQSLGTVSLYKQIYGYFVRQRSKAGK